MTEDHPQSSISKDMTVHTMAYVLITPARNEAKFIEKVTERVWQLLEEDLRREQERRGKRFGS